MNISSALSLFNIIVPLLTIVGIIFRYRYTRRIGVLIMIPSLIYLIVYYVVFLYMVHFGTNFNIAVLQIPFRIAVVFLTLSLLIYVVSDTISLRIIQRKYKEEIQEKINGKHS